MKNSNVFWIADSIDYIRRQLGQKLPRRTPKYDIDDAVQRVCMIALKKLGEETENLGKARVRAWLRKACTYEVMKYRTALYHAIERFGREEIMESALPCTRKLPTEEVLPQCVDSVWPQLNEEQRIVLRMALEGASVDQIASALGCRPGKVYKLRREIIALFLAQKDESFFGLVPMVLVRSKHAHPLAWKLGIGLVVAIVTVILWLVGKSDGDDPEAASPAANVASEPEEPEPPRRGQGRLPLPPPEAPSPVSIEAAPVLTVPHSLEGPATTKDVPSKGVSRSKRGRRSAGRSLREPPGPPVDVPGTTPDEELPQPPSHAREEDLQLVANARRAYRRGDYSAVIELVHEHQRRFPVSDMAMERSTLAIKALCALGRVEEASVKERVLRTRHDPGILLCEAPRMPIQPAHRTQTR